MELVNEAYRRRDAASADALHFAAATAASLIFPFAPHAGAEVYELLTGDRVWEQPWPAADPALLERDVVVIARAGQRQAARPHRGARGRVARAARVARARAAERAAAIWTATRSRR